MAIVSSNYYIRSETLTGFLLLFLVIGYLELYWQVLCFTLNPYFFLELVLGIFCTKRGCLSHHYPRAGVLEFSVPIYLAIPIPVDDLDSWHVLDLSFQPLLPKRFSFDLLA